MKPWMTTRHPPLDSQGAITIASLFPESGTNGRHRCVMDCPSIRETYRLLIEQIEEPGWITQTEKLVDTYVN